MEQPNNLTKGNVTDTLLKFFFPMLWTNILQQVYTIVDSIIVGKGLGDNALASVGNLSSLHFLIIGFSMGITSGFAVIIGQNYGSNGLPSVRRSVAQSVRLSAILSVILTAAGCASLKSLLVMMQTDEAILSGSLLYGYIIFGGLSVTVAYNLASGILRSLGDSRTPFIAIVISTLVNICLDYVLIFFFHTSVEGAAAATVLAQALSAFICFLKLRKLPETTLSGSDFIFDATISKLLLKNGIPMACMNSVTAVGCIVVQSYINMYGVIFTAAYSACIKFLNLFMLPSITAGLAGSAFVSQNYGAKRPDRIRQGVHVCAGIALISYFALGSVMLLLPRLIAGFMLNGEETIALAVQYFRICGVALIFLNLLLVYRSCVQGMGYPIIPMFSGILEMVLRIPVIILLLPRLGFRAAAYAECAAWTGAFLLNFIAYIVYYNRFLSDCRNS